MMLIEKEHELATSGVQSSGNFSLSVGDEIHLMNVLAEGIYSDKVGALLREYGANAWDAHRAANKADVPIKVTIPTDLEPVLVIRDYGEGLSEEEVYQVYTQYGKSTKRGSDIGVGMLGIGSKAGFCYSDSFTVTTWKDGSKRIYVATKDEDGRGKMLRLHEEACDLDETGVEVSISVSPSDVPEFVRKAKLAYAYYEPHPIINTTLPILVRDVKKHGFFTAKTDETSGWVAVMGCVPYRINLEQIKLDLQEAGVYAPLFKTSGGLFFGMRDVQFSASREDLKYTPFTKAALVAKFAQLIEDYLEESLAVLADENTSSWDKRLKAIFVQDSMSLSIPERYKSWSVSAVQLIPKDANNPVKVVDLDGLEDLDAGAAPTFHAGARTFNLLREGVQSAHLVAIARNSKLWIAAPGETRSMRGFNLGYYEYVIAPVNDYSLEEVQANLQELLAQAKLDGIPVSLLSERNWYAPTHYGRSYDRDRTPNKKHSVRTFKLIDKVREVRPYSENWEIESRVPQKDDVFVVLDSFETVDYDQFYRKVGRDRTMAKNLGFEMPPIYGYKTTQKHPVKEADCVGVHYRQWRRDFFKKVLTPELIELEQDRQWAEVIQAREVKENPEKYLKVLEPKLGGQHPVIFLFKRHLQGVANIGKVPKEKVSAANYVVTVSKALPAFEASKALEDILKAYPLMVSLGGLNVIASANLDNWIDYVKLVDRRPRRKGKQQ